MFVKVEINDTEPVEKERGMMWLDTSNNTNILKIWDGTKWLVVHF